MEVASTPAAISTMLSSAAAFHPSVGCCRFVCDGPGIQGRGSAVTIISRSPQVPPTNVIAVLSYFIHMYVCSRVRIHNGCQAGWSSSSHQQRHTYFQKILFSFRAVAKPVPAQRFCLAYYSTGRLADLNVAEVHRKVRYGLVGTLTE